MTDHICPKPGCGMLEERVLVGRLTTYHDEHYIYECPRNADAHALCARVAELEKALSEAANYICDGEGEHQDPPCHGCLKRREFLNIARQEGGTP